MRAGPNRDAAGMLQGRDPGSRPPEAGAFGPRPSGAVYLVRSRDGLLACVGTLHALAALVKRDESRYAPDALVRDTGPAASRPRGSRPAGHQRDFSAQPTGKIQGGGAAASPPSDVLPMPGVALCEHCGQPMGSGAVSPLGGRPRRFCSSRCRQAHHRAVVWRAQ